MKGKDNMNDLVPVIQNNISMREVANLFSLSKLFKDTETEAKAYVKIMAGKELGLGPFASMRLVQVIQGQIQLSGHGIATLIDAHPEYDYQIEGDITAEKGCTISFYRGGKVGSPKALKRGTYSFGPVDAKKAGLDSQLNYKKFDRDMYFNRCLSSGYKKYIPGVTHGIAVYVEGELPPEENKPVPQVVDVVVECSSVPLLRDLLKIAGKDLDDIELQLGCRIDLSSEEQVGKVISMLKPVIEMKG